METTTVVLAAPVATAVLVVLLAPPYGATGVAAAAELPATIASVELELVFVWLIVPTLLE